MMWIYHLAVRVYGLAIRAASLRNRKAAGWIEGRRGWRQKLRNERDKLFSGEIIWIHCASYGEFEQGRPLIEALRKKYPSCALVLSFFSPSGYEPFSKWAGADLVTYLPLDTRRNAIDFVEILKPRAAIFIKYEFWLNYLEALHNRQIKTYLVSAIFRPHHPFFKWYGGMFRRALKYYDRIFLQDVESEELLRQLRLDNFMVTGDTRFDRVTELKRNFTPVPAIEAFAGSAKLIIAGSTWPGDEALIIAAWKKLRSPEYKLIIAPHNVSDRDVESLCGRLDAAAITYSVFTRGAKDAGVLVLDTMGMLSQVYGHGTVAYVGGGFNSGIHNTLEPAVYGLPVTFYGNSFHRFHEAVELVKLKSAFQVADADSLAGVWQYLLTHEDERAAISERLDAFFAANGDSTSKVLAALEI